MNVMTIICSVIVSNEVLLPDFLSNMFIEFSQFECLSVVENLYKALCIYNEK